MAACGSDPHATADAPLHADAGHDAALDAFVPQDAPAHRQGQVAIAKGTGPSGPLTSVSATFVEGSIYGMTVATDGPCTLYQAAPSSQFSAGVITVTGTTTAFTLTPSGGHYTVAPTPPTNLFTDGATITVHADGAAEFPTFSGTVTAPTAIAGFTPPSTISRAGYTATWTAGAGPKIWVLLVGVHGSASDGIICRVNDTGSFALPASTFALLPAIDTSGAIAIARVSENVLITPDVSLVAVTEALSLVTIAP